MAELIDPAPLERVRDFMLSFQLISEGRGWATLHEIAEMTGVHERYVPAILGYLQRTRYGGYIVGKRHRENIGTYEYQVRKRAIPCSPTTPLSELHDPPLGIRFLHLSPGV